MNNSVFLLYFCNFLLIGSLPFTFFRRGRKNIRWWITAMPFFICITFLIIAYIYQASFFNHGKSWQLQTDLVATILSIASISLLCYTVGTHKAPLNLWHQNNDDPGHIVTYGSYKIIRHPFYTSFIFALLGASIYFIHPVTLLTFLYGLISMYVTATMEEKKLSRHSEEYRNYMKSTGRFLPNLLAETSKKPDNFHKETQEK